MKHLLIFLILTIFSLASNPFDTLVEKRPQESKTIEIVIKIETKSKNSQKFHKTYQSALQGDINAQFDVAMMYGTGINVEKNEREAFNWLHKSAFNGHVQAKYLMGLSFKQGTGVRVQKDLARYWFKKAVKAGHQKAIFQLAELDRELQPKRAKSRYASNEF